MPQNIVRKHCPQNVEIGCVDCSAILGRVVVAGWLCVVLRREVELRSGLRMFRPLSIDSGSTRAHDKAPRLWVPAYHPPEACQRPSLDIVL